jgi:Fe-S oxidoreductase
MSLDPSKLVGCGGGGGGGMEQELANVIADTFSEPASSTVASWCPVCARMHESVRERRTLAEQPHDLFVIKLMDYSVIFFSFDLIR